MKKKYGALSSSIDPNKLSTTVLAAAKVLGGAAVFFGLFTTETNTLFFSNVNQLVLTTMTLAPLAYSAWHSAEVIFGLIQKAIVAYATKPKDEGFVPTSPDSID